MSDLILFWHRRDLRLSDNLGLAEAQRQGERVVGVFCLDPTILASHEMAPARVAYLMGCLRELQERYAQVGSQLLFLKGDPRIRIPAIANALNVKAVFWNRDVEPYARSRDTAVRDALRERGIPVQVWWDQLLHEPKSIYTGAKAWYTVYTPFWKKWSSLAKAEPVLGLVQTTGLTGAEQEIAESVGTIALPSAKELGFNWTGPWVLPPGEVAARERLGEFGDRALMDYQDNRNYPYVDGTSRLSPALKFGTIGIRTVWAKTGEILDQCRSDEARAAVITWRQELAWREFYQYVLFHFPELADGPYRQPFRNFPWVNDPEQFAAWCEGRTGVPIVDAAMRQLRETGWMHNRCRMIVASFLVKDLIVDWRWGELFFMQHLVDGDLAANNGGWQWSASSGMDPKPLRIFNPATQTQKFDAEAAYIREWLPELRGIETEVLVTGRISQGDRERCGYPGAIIDHAQQQRRFKELYARVKAEA